MEAKVMKLHEKLWEVGMQDRFLRGEDQEVGSLLRQAAWKLRVSGTVPEFDPNYRDCCDTGECLRDDES